MGGQDIERRRPARAGQADFERDRARIAADLHDDTLQVLSVAILRLELLERSVPEAVAPTLQDLSTLLRSAAERLRLVVTGLDEATPSASELEAACGSLVGAALSGSDVLGVVNVLVLDEISPEACAVVLRNVQEAVYNARVHGSPTLVTVDVLVDRDSVIATVADNGIGFDGDPSRDQVTGHIGLRRARARAEEVGGHFSAVGHTGRGATVSCWLPNELGPP
jgi:signal transduction histidine kinase